MQLVQLDPYPKRAQPHTHHTSTAAASTDDVTRQVIAMDGESPLGPAAAKTIQLSNIL
jgi:hypothetical protein